MHQNIHVRLNLQPDQEPYVLAETKPERPPYQALRAFFEDVGYRVDHIDASPAEFDAWANVGTYNLPVDVRRTEHPLTVDGAYVLTFDRTGAKLLHTFLADTLERCYDIAPDDAPENFDPEVRLAQYLADRLAHLLPAD